MTPDMAQYLGVFLDEGQEQLGLLEANILPLERGDHSTETLQVLFRAAHTLKGSSRAMGFLAIGDLTHEMENVLDDLRNDKLAVSTPIVNALLECLDALAPDRGRRRDGRGHRRDGQGHPGPGRPPERAPAGRGRGAAGSRPCPDPA